MENKKIITTRSTAIYKFEELWKRILWSNSWRREKDNQCLLVWLWLCTFNIRSNMPDSIIGWGAQAGEYCLACWLFQGIWLAIYCENRMFGQMDLWSDSGQFLNSLNLVLLNKTNLFPNSLGKCSLPSTVLIKNLPFLPK